MPCLFDRLIRGGSIGLLVAVDVECRLTRLKGYHNVEMSAIKLPLPPDLNSSRLLLVRLGRSRVIPPHALAAAALLLIAAAAETATFLLVPGAQGLSAKGQVLVLDDGGLDPGVGRGVDFAG
ncbi:hypothetical protein FALCPG4_003871 [Fusarium falciforme]